jgi:hypothetical protein
VNVSTVQLANRRHYARPETNRTLCGRTGHAIHVDGAADCGRCVQIIERVDTSRGRHAAAS